MIIHLKDLNRRKKRKIIKIISSTLILFIIFTILSISLPQTSEYTQYDEEEEYPTEIEEIDVEIIDWLNEDSIESQISKTANEYGIDPVLAIVISAYETGYWKSNAYLTLNNFGGMSTSEGLMKFNSKEEGLDAYISMLADHYQGMSLEVMSKKYCPPNHKNWYESISSMYEMRGSEYEGESSM